MGHLGGELLAGQFVARSDNWPMGDRDTRSAAVKMGKELRNMSDPLRGGGRFQEKQQIRPSAIPLADLVQTSGLGCNRMPEASRRASHQGTARRHWQSGLGKE